MCLKNSINKAFFKLNVVISLINCCRQTNLYCQVYYLFES